MKEIYLTVWNDGVSTRTNFRPFPNTSEIAKSMEKAGLYILYYFKIKMK